MVSQHRHIRGQHFLDREPICRRFFSYDLFQEEGLPRCFQNFRPIRRFEVFVGHPAKHNCFYPEISHRTTERNYLFSGTPRDEDGTRFRRAPEPDAHWHTRDSFA
jgi:hypothetical protein